MLQDSPRWMIAQSYEKNWWQKRTEKLDLDFYESYAQDLILEVRDLLDINKNTSILEIGSGAAGILTFLDSDSRYAIDPLEDFYASVSRFREFRNKNVHYSRMKAENLTFDDQMFDLIINDNVLDHCEDPERVLGEMKRVLKKDGVIYLRLVTYQWWGKLVRNLLEKFQIDRGHPHTFRKRDLLAAYDRVGLKVIRSKSKGYFKSWLGDLRSGTIKGSVKAILCATRDKTLYLLKKSDPALSMSPA